MVRHLQAQQILLPGQLRVDQLQEQRLVADATALFRLIGKQVELISVPSVHIGLFANEAQIFGLLAIAHLQQLADDARRMGLIAIAALHEDVEGAQLHLVIAGRTECHRVPGPDLARFQRCENGGLQIAQPVPLADDLNGLAVGVGDILEAAPLGMRDRDYRIFLIITQIPANDIFSQAELAQFAFVGDVADDDIDGMICRQLALGDEHAEGAIAAPPASAPIAFSCPWSRAWDGRRGDRVDRG
ncbi:hypothetical protein ACFSUK_07970 [Sphingobium scionense]